MLKLFDKKKRWALVSDRKWLKKEIYVSRNSKDGKSVSIRQNVYGAKWMIVDVEELMLALLHVTHTEDELSALVSLTEKKQS